jgi:hypothetical protein
MIPVKTVKTLKYKKETIFIENVENETNVFSWRFKTIEINGEGSALQPYCCDSIKEAVKAAKSVIDCLDEDTAMMQEEEAKSRG